MRVLQWLLLVLWPGMVRADEVRLDFPDSVELRVLVDYVAASLRVNVVYAEDALAGKKVTLRAHQAVERAALLPLLRTVLRSRGLALLDLEQPGWYRVVPAEQLAGESGPLQREPRQGADAGQVITQAVAVRAAEQERIKAAVAPYLSKPGGVLLPIPEAGLLVVTDFAGNVRRIAELVALLERGPAAAAQLVTLPVKHQEPAELIVLLSRFLTPPSAQPSLPGAAPTAFADIRLEPDPLGAGIIALGSAERIERVRELIAQFDRPMQRRTELYQPRYLSVARLKTLVENLLLGAPLRLSADAESNLLVAVARDEDHLRIRELLARLDASAPRSDTPMRFYKLMNRRADDVFTALGGLLLGVDPHPAGAAPSHDAGVSAATAGPPHVGSDSPKDGLANPSNAASTVRAARPRDTAGALIPTPQYEPGDESSGERRRGRGVSLRGANFALSLDEHTNSIIALAPPELHVQIEELIRKLDQRRPQVLVEVTLVSISVEDSLNIGVELEALDLGDPWDFLLFTSFGLSNITPATGARRLNVMAGGSGALLAPDEVPILLNALQTSGRTKVFAAPRILVDDNAQGRIESVAESPFSSVNASNTVATTSFAGFAKAGTQLSIAPHIAEGAHLEIEYTLTVSSFTGAGSATTPPPRSSDTINSTVRVPDGYSVVIGGLQSETLGESASQLPLAGDLPLVGWLFGNRSQSRSRVRLYAFIKPTILRQERFEDLKYLSERELKAAEVHNDLPARYQYMK